ncbi:MAG: hypothetical protein KME11_04980 [Timaviella obliquedivisa GSE-PSE-MK23-08B]|jgi:hypothetical protein|nr:hypothetical protein [Timaviella obliquedivisa GSE-PSE-MK23-08B]
MPLAYLSVLEAQKRLLLLGFFTEETMPSTEKLEFFLEQIESRMDEWIGYRVASMEYSETVCSSDSTLALLTYYPLIAVNSVENAPGQPPRSLPLLDKMAIGDIRLIDLQYPHTCFKVLYNAGLQPVPKIFTDVAFEILAKVFELSAGSLAMLSQPVRDTEEISLPGGLKKKYKVGGSDRPSGNNGGTELDRLMLPLEQYKTQIFTTGSR